MTTQIHDSDTCTVGVNGQPCEMCQFAEKSAKERWNSPSEASRLGNQGMEQAASEPKNVSSSPVAQNTAISALDFNHHWNSASPQHTRYTEKNEAEHWFRRGLWVGIQYERERGLLAMNGDLREMQRLARERVGR